ncbi:Na+/H+ antiporter subunit E [Pseudomonas sp. ZM23]|uniref:Na+/H+ antiporter subunit E n=1 Tax=Pseudomonas triclosanedens TaxID=2961893 RepID=A0ABY7A4L0_9PSED|nr:Na+/H+ antiporter subunit E [Pseudomonas triclosanedens]MCP8464367.1 Na+/H+ antiporter subunit E [Pseudomonas triclosanedens]MCP8471501.1 Na+/H+ antiporter subunit E [Pseudomonas triclosanedens]MCP8477690.1 Na+/H+ antiporter subunit E [Pseudomonas triclosanedens]WAI51145.1 Na+/H+ antiporter subunit E [Pseudomonas triclosanedens]
MIRRVLPHPLLSVVLLLSWLLMVNDFSLGHWVLGAFLGLALPLLCRNLLLSAPRIRRPGLLLRFIALVLYDIVVANLQVAKLVLGPRSRLQPGFVEIPLELTDDLAITILASVITLTPGTCSADLSADRRTLLVHGIDVPDPQALVADIKARYEAPLKEVFECSAT